MTAPLIFYFRLPNNCKSFKNRLIKSRYSSNAQYSAMDIALSLSVVNASRFVLLASYAVKPTKNKNTDNTDCKIKHAVSDKHHICNSGNDNSDKSHHTDASKA